MLEIEEDPAFARMEWRAQHIGWIVMMAIVVCASVGLLGQGPMSDRTLRGSNLEIRYDNIMRNGAPGNLNLRVKSPAVVSGDTVIKVWADEAFIESCHPVSIIPMPTHVLLNGETTYWYFPVHSGMSMSTIRITCSPVQIGIHRGNIGLEGGEEFMLSLLVLP